MKKSSQSLFPYLLITGGRRLLLCLALILATTGAKAQRFMDKLDRGLVAVYTNDNPNNGVFLSWRRLGEEYYGVKYNVYRGSTRIAENLEVTNYVDKVSAGGTSSSSYTVRAVVNGVEQAACAAVTPWSRVSSNGYAGYKDFSLYTPIYARDGMTDMTNQYRPNDIEMADLDGDGQLDILLKRQSVYDGSDYYLKRTTEATEAYDLIEAYKVDYQAGTLSRLWWIDVGPNMVSLNSTELNMLAYDWDEDGKAEVLLRGADGMIIHKANGETVIIGDPSVDTRDDVDHSKDATFTNTGKEYLIYLNGTTGEVYDNIEYPLKRIEDSEYATWSAQGKSEKDMEQLAWGTGLAGHRSSKYFMGAPFLDGRKASIFLGRGIYTRHKFAALDVNSSHKLVERWRWSCSDNTSPWFGNGYHNFVIADVDEDGRDEIVYGSMVIDDNGKGLHTTGYQHGDAMQVRDFDPWRKGLEIYACLEDEPYWGSNYRNGTTGEVYYKYSTPVSGGKKGDDGRCLAGNFYRDIPGSQGRSVFNGLIALSQPTPSEIYDKTSSDKRMGWSHLNFRTYWDGDLVDEVLDATGSNDNGSTAMVVKFGGEGSDAQGKGTRLFTSESGTLTNNGTKNNPCFSGDILGDWREEFIMRKSETSICLYTTVATTDYDIPTLWHDKQYRQAMGTQMMVYNLPPNPSFFLGELEEITVAPPPVTNRGRTEINNGGSITSAHNNAHVMLAQTNNMTVSVAEGASPQVFTDNAPSWIQGTDVNGTTATKVKTPGDGSVGVKNLPPIKYEYYTHTLTGAAFTGETQVSKQGLGTLVLPKVTQTYTGPTKVWEGTLQFDGTMESSPVWMNRHTTLSTDGGTFTGGVKMEYGSLLAIGGETAGTVGSVTVNGLTLNFGSEVVFDIVGTGAEDNDRLNVNGTLAVEKKTTEEWLTYGPERKAPVLTFRSADELSSGRYPIGHIDLTSGDVSSELIAKVATDFSGLKCERATLGYDSDTKTLYLDIEERSLEEYTGSLDIELSGMTAYHLPADIYPSAGETTFYLPVVKATATAFSDVTPYLTGTFTSSITGAVTDLGSNQAAELLSEDYESASDASSWIDKSANKAVLELATGDATYGKYIYHYTNGDANRSIYTLFPEISESRYTIEFDASIKAGNVAERSESELVIMSGSATIPTITNVGCDFEQTNAAGTNYLFHMKAANSQTFAINNGATTLTLDASKWYHYKLTVDTEARKADYLITQGSTTAVSGTFDVPEGTNCTAKGIFMLDGRGSGYLKFDNLSIKTVPVDFSSFAFPEPGVLEVTAHADKDGYKTKSGQFEAELPYYRAYNLDLTNPDSIASYKARMASAWSSDPTKGRWAGWYYPAGLSGDARNVYDMYKFNNNTAPIYIDTNKFVWASRRGGTGYEVHFIEYEGIAGIGTNRGSSDLTGITINAGNLGNGKTILFDEYYKKTDGNVEMYEGGKYIYANADGTYQHTANDNLVLRKFQIYLPVAILDELATQPLPALTSGNALLYRPGFIAGNWSTLVLPYAMTVAQQQDVFGEGVNVAVLSNFADNKLSFTERQPVEANKPFMISGVSKPSPYVLTAVSGTPVDVPIASTGVIDFIGTYVNKGSTPFTTSDYFFTAGGGGRLSRVTRDGLRQNLKGYRAYFHDNGSGANMLTISFEDAATGIARNGAGDTATGVQPVYDLQGRRVGTWENGRLSMRVLQPGIYIVNGHRLIITNH